MMIVKCQRSLMTTLGAPQMMFYNRTRSWQWMGDLTSEWNKQFGPTMSPEDNRFFAEVIWPNKREMPEFVKRLPEQFF